MGVVYRNNFDRPFYGDNGFLHGEHDGKLVGFDPTQDDVGLGRLYVAANAGAAAHFEVSPAGADVTVTAPQTTSAKPISETIYATLRPGFLRDSETYTAELRFDLPRVADGTQPIWSVGLNYK